MSAKINFETPIFEAILDSHGNPVEVNEITSQVEPDVKFDFEVKEDGRKFYPFNRFEAGDVADIDYRGEIQRVYVEEMGRFGARVRLVNSEGYLSDSVGMSTNAIAALVEENVELKEQPDTSRKFYVQDQYELLPL